MFATGALPAAWRLAGSFLAAAASSRYWPASLLGGRPAPAWLTGEICHTVVFILGLYLANLALELPWGLYSTFVVEQRHGFNKQTAGLYVSDMLKQVVWGWGWRCGDGG